MFDDDGDTASLLVGKTELTGAQITSTQAAIDQGKNRYEAKQGTSTTDLQNSARYEAKSVSVGLGAGTPAPGKSLSAGLSGVGVGSDSGSASSTSTAGISGVAGDLGARTGDKEAGLKPIFDKDKARLHLLICRSLLIKKKGALTCSSRTHPLKNLHRTRCTSLLNASPCIWHCFSIIQTCLTIHANRIAGTEAMQITATAASGGS